MPDLTTWNGDLHVNGALSSKDFNAPVGSIRDEDIESNANVAASKLQRSCRALLEQESATTAVSERRVVHVVRGAAGTVQEFLAGSVVANVGAATITVDLLKNGASILVAPVTLNSTHAAYELVAAAVLSPGLVQGDVLEIDVVATAGGGTLGQGLFSLARVDEDGI